MTFPGGRFGVLAAAVLFSTGGTAIKACSLDAWSVAGLRSAVAMVAMAVLLPQSRALPGPAMLATAAAYAATVLLFVLANKTTTAANAIFLQSTAPVYIALLSPKLLGEPLKKSDLAHLAWTAAGVSLFLIGLPPSQASAPRPILGNALALTAGITWALTLIGLRYASRSKEHGGSNAAFWGNAVAFIAAAAVAGIPRSIGAADAALIAYLGIFQIGLGYAFLNSSFKTVSSTEASLLLMLEPAISPIWAWLVHAENPGGLAWAGAGMLLGGGVARALWERHEHRVS